MPAGPMLPHIAHRVGISTVDVGPLVQAGALGGLAGSALCPLLPLQALLPGGLLGLAASLVAVPHATTLTGALVVVGDRCFEAAGGGAVLRWCKPGGEPNRRCFLLLMGASTNRASALTSSVQLFCLLRRDGHGACLRQHLLPSGERATNAWRKAPLSDCWCGAREA